MAQATLFSGVPLPAANPPAPPVGSVLLSETTLPLESLQFVAFDLETTGTSPVSAKVVEIGAVRFNLQGDVLAVFNQLVNPCDIIPLAVQRVHGITPAMVQDQPTICEVLPRWLEFVGIGPQIFLAHNARFDMAFLAVAMIEHRLPLPNWMVLDTVWLARKRWHDVPNYKLSTLAAHFPKPRLQFHRALSDAELVRLLFLRLLEGGEPLQTLSQITQLTKPIYYEKLEIEPLLTLPAGLESLRQTRPVRLFYGSPAIPLTVTPQAVFRFRKENYLTAYCHHGRRDKRYRLDRIHHLEPISAA